MATSQNEIVVPRNPIITLRFSGCPPPPEAAVTDPTPDEQFDMAEQKRQNEIKAREEAEAAKQSKGFGKLLGSVANTVNAAASNLQATGESAIRNQHITKNRERFAKNFPQLVAAGEQVITDYDCRVLHQGQKVDGHAIVTNNYLCFSSVNLLEAIPLREIASIRRSVALETFNQGPPFIMITPAPNVISNTLQVFTVKQQLFQFVDFSSILVKAGTLAGSQGVNGNCFERFFNFLDHAWRAVTPVPLPNVQYAS